MNISKRFNSKILLFGEYSIILNSTALAYPYELFDGRLTFQKRNISIDQELKAFAQYIKNLKNKNELLCDLDISSFEFDVGQGLYFNSTIPQGYGVGSSGALCASVYHQYVLDKNEVYDDLGHLKDIFSQLESHFHGASSGVDPLISYINRPMLMRGKNSINTVDFPNYKQGKGAIFLLNTGRSRRTEPLVNLFLEKVKTDDFNKLAHEVLIPITDDCVRSFLDSDITTLYEKFRQLSDFQYRYFTPMIPKLYRELWEAGLKTEDYYLKLCGAGGGGFILGITKDFSKTCELLVNYQVKTLFSFN